MPPLELLFGSIRSIVVRNLLVPAPHAAPITCLVSHPDGRLLLALRASPLDLTDPEWHVPLDSLPCDFSLKLVDAADNVLLDVVVNELVPMGLFRDLERARKLPVNSVFFVAGGRLYAPRALYQKLVGQPWVRNAVAPPLQADDSSESEFARLVAIVGNERVASMLDALARARRARAAVQSLPWADALAQRAAAVEAQLADKRAWTVHHALVERRDALAQSVAALAAQASESERALERKTLEARSRAEGLAVRAARERVAHAESQARASKQEAASRRALQARRLVLAYDVARVLPLARTDADEDAGRAAHVVGLLALIFGVPLRFAPVYLANKSVVVDPVHLAESRPFRELLALSAADSPACYPLHAVEPRARLDVGHALLNVGAKQLARSVEGQLGLAVADEDDGGGGGDVVALCARLLGALRVL